MIVALVALVVAVLASVALSTGNQADSASARDRNSAAALGVTEAGVHEAIAKIESLVASDSGFVRPFSFTGSTAEGSYSVDVTRVSQGFLIDAQGTVGGDQTGRTRRVHVSLLPPETFGDGKAYSLFSSTSTDVRNNDVVIGDVWSNDSITMRPDSRLDGSLTSAQSWIKLESRAIVNGNAWSGGFDPVAGSAISLAAGSTITGWAKASVTAPTDPETCSGATAVRPHYDAATASTSSIAGTVTTFGQVNPALGTTGPRLEGVCTPAPAPIAMPTFTFNRSSYDPATYREFSSVAAFQSWLNTPSTNGQNLIGTFVVNESAPSQAKRIDLTGTKLLGDVTLITNAPVMTGAIDDTKVAGRAVVTIVSNYAPPTSTACEVSSDTSECAIHLKNNLDASCRTAVLAYSNRGPTAIKNVQPMCGSVIAQGVLLRNSQTVRFDAAVQRVVGLGPSSYEIARWEECRPRRGSSTEPCDA